MNKLKNLRNCRPNFKIGSKELGTGLFIIAGPCAVESREQIMESAKIISEAGADMLRGGAFKPRTSIHSFQGLGEKGLKFLKEAGLKYGLPVVSEITSAEQIKTAEKYLDAFQIGARNVQNYELLKAVGKSKKPVLFKNGLGTTTEEWLNAAEYIASGGNHKIILVQRGIRTFEDSTRFTLDISSVPVIKSRVNLPVFIDPSHAAGSSKLVPPLAIAGIAAGADGILVEVHPSPEKAMSDQKQQLNGREFTLLAEKLRKTHKFIEAYKLH